MLLIPFDRKPDWKRPPIVTLGLILANVLAFLLFQANELDQLDRAVDYYTDSGLMELEREQYLRERSGPDADAVSDKPADQVLWHLLNDPAFMAEIRDGTAVPADHPDHAGWREKRAAFDDKLDSVTFWAWGLRPAEPEPLTLLTHMFLHGDMVHLLGNMLFLLAIGFLVEGAIGSRLMLVAYLLGGVLAGAADLVIAGDRFIPGVGASGAIAAMMGMYCVLFGRTRVQFFYFVWVYFNVTRAPAILLLPLWLGYELASWFWLDPDGNINYAAHAAGLAAGALMALGLTRLWPISIDRDYVQQPAAETDPRQQLARTDAHMRELEFEQARPLLEHLLAGDPDNPELLQRLYRCLQLQPQSEAYHRVSRRILGLNARTAADTTLVAETFRDYTHRARPRPRLDGRLIQSLGILLARQGLTADAERLLAVARRNRLPETPDMLVAIAEAHLRARHPERAQSHLEALLRDYPAHSQTEYGRHLLRQVHGGAGYPGKA